MVPTKYHNPPPVWEVIVSQEVDEWYQTLTPTGKADTDKAIEALTLMGNNARMPLSKPLGDQLFELRFTCERTARRITYTFDPEKKIITLTTFRHQKRTEQREIARARKVLKARRKTK